MSEELKQILELLVLEGVPEDRIEEVMTNLLLGEEHESIDDDQVVG